MTSGCDCNKNNEMYDYDQLRLRREKGQHRSNGLEY